ncbi:MAG TPA: PDZ domain-containing protein, partial [Puia sp.]|nr:PDZ domain-containing protein [Puia sp.]
GDIMPGSPAEKAGLKVDDILVSVNTNFSNNIEAYKALLQNAGERVKLIVRRHGELITLDMKVKTID